MSQQKLSKDKKYQLNHSNSSPNLPLMKPSECTQISIPTKSSHINNSTSILDLAEHEDLMNSKIHLKLPRI